MADLVQNQYIDTPDGLKRLGGNTALYKKVLGMLLDSSEFAALDTHLAGGDWEAAAKSAHTIKGMAANLSLPLLTQHSTGLMTQLRQGPPADGAVDTYRQALEQTLAQIRQTLDTLV